MNGQKLNIGVALKLTDLVSALIVANVSSYKLVDMAMTKLSAVLPARQKQACKVFRQQGISEGEEVDVNHPLYRQVTESILSADIDLSRSDLQLFKATQLSTCLKGVRISYAERKFLEYYLVKP